MLVTIPHRDENYELNLPCRDKNLIGGRLANRGQ